MFTYESLDANLSAPGGFLVFLLCKITLLLLLALLKCGFGMRNAKWTFFYFNQKHTAVTALLFAIFKQFTY